MNGLVSGYGSDSDEEPVKAKEENEIAKEAQVKGVKSGRGNTAWLLKYSFSFDS